MENENKEVEKFDPSKLMDGVRDRIKATFVSLIDDAQWEVMCKTEMDKFFKPIPIYGYNNKIDGYKPSEFEAIVINLMKEKCTAHLKELFSKPEYSMETIWEINQTTNNGSNKPKLSEHLDAMIKEKMPDMMNAMFSSVMADAFYSFFNNIQHKLQINR